MIGVVVVTHGQLATELVNAAEMIVGDLPQFAAVSIGWHVDVESARQEIERAIARVQGPDGVLVLTDMFGGTPANLGVTFLEANRVEVITADVTGRLRLNLRNRRASRSGSGPDLLVSGPRPLASRTLANLRGPVILVADELSASIAAQVEWEEVVGFVSDAGSWTYHTAILARSLRVPAIVGLRGASAVVPPGAWLAIDGASGDVRVDPSEEELAALEAATRSARASAPALEEFRRLPAVTPDGVRVTLEANIEVADETADARAHGAQGVGLCRSEFLVGVAPGAAGEEAQYEAYRRIIEAMAPAPVTIRTFDVVEDDREPRGRAGLRGLRLGLARREAFRVQLRALLRAARHGRLRILFPFVTGLDELREARRVVTEVAADLAARGEALLRCPSAP